MPEDDSMEEIPEPKERFRLPTFLPSFPKDVLDQWHSLNAVERFTLEQQSIRGQQLDWAIEKLAAGDARMRYYDQKIAKFDKLLTIFTAKKSIFVLIVGSLLVPGFLLWLGTMIQKWVSSGGKP